MNQLFKIAALLFLFIPFSIGAQDFDIDSLEARLNPIQSDTSRVNTLILLVKAHYGNEIDKSQEYAEEALKLSQELKFVEGIGESQFQLGLIYSRKNLPKISLQYYSDSQKSFIELGRKDRIATIYNNVGVIYKNQGLYTQAREYYDQALRLYEELEDKRSIGDTYSNIGVVYRKQGKYDEAIKYYIRALKIREETNDQQGVAITYGNMGNLYNDLGDYDKALETYQVSMDNFIEVGNKQAVGILLNNMGELLVKTNKYKQASDNYLKALEVHTELDNQTGIANSYTNIGRVNYEEGNYIEALKNFEAALEIFEKLGDQQSIAELKIDIGELFINMRFFDKALENLNSGIDIAKSVGHRNTILKGYDGLYSYYEEKGEYEKSLEYYKLYTSLKDSIYNLDKTKQIAEIETKYEIEKKSQENALLRKDQEVKNQIIRRQNFQNIASIVAIVFVLAFALYLYQNYKEKQRTNQLLTEQNETLSKRRQQIVAINESLKQSEKQLNEANSELTRLNQGLEHTVEERTQELQQANEELDTFLYQSSHALRRPIAQVKGLIQLARMENGDLNKVEAVYEKIDDTSTRMDLMLRKLVMASEINLAKPNPERINFKQVIEESWELLSNTMEVNKVKLDYKVGENIEYEADRRLINIIFNNLLENAILYQSNHRHREGEVAVSIENGQSRVKIAITDNGIGISDAVISEIFDLFSIGTDKTKGYGLGLYIVKKAVDKLNGEITVESKEHEFTQFHLSLPLS